MANATGIDPNAYRQSLINSGDIVSLSRNAAMIQVDIDFYTQMLAETDINTRGIKANLIKKKLAELQQQLAATEMGVGAASNAIISQQNEALGAQSDLLDRAEQSGITRSTSPTSSSQAAGTALAMALNAMGLPSQIAGIAGQSVLSGGST